MKILVIGNGGREHALCDTFDKQGHDVVAFPVNAGTEPFHPGEALDVMNFQALVDFVQTNAIDLTVVGPEKYLEAGIADFFGEKKCPLFGPNRHAAKLESSKSFAKDFMKKHGIPTADFALCRTKKEAEGIVAENFDAWGGVVIKPSGLTAGKGVMVCPTKEEAADALRIHFDEKKYGSASDEVVVEELLSGEECSLLAFCDGSTILPMIPSQDHKRLFENDAGPNTGGVGAYAPLPSIDPHVQSAIEQTIVTPTLEGLKKEGIHYIGIIYFGLMMSPKGPKVLEYNCRFGDPEAQVVLPLLRTDLASVMHACCQSKLQEIQLEWNRGSACVVVLCSGGYPHSYQTGYEIEGLTECSQMESVAIFHAGTEKDEKGRCITSGGRVLGVTGIGPSLADAVASAYRGVSKVSFTDLHYRRDIASRALREVAP